MWNVSWAVIMSRVQKVPVLQLSDTSLVTLSIDSYSAKLDISAVVLFQQLVTCAGWRVSQSIEWDMVQIDHNQHHGAEQLGPSAPKGMAAVEWMPC